MSSRYASCATLEILGPSGLRIQYLAPRLLPQAPALGAGGGTTVRPGEVHRLDLIAQRTLGSPELAWRIADANNAMDPFAICELRGASLQLPGSQL